MAAIILPSRWQTQPRGRVEIDWSHPLAKNLRFFIANLNGLGVPIDLVSYQVGTVSGSARTEGSFIPQGSGIVSKLTSASSDYYSWSNIDAHNILTEITLAWRGMLSTVGGYRHFAGKHASNGGTNNPFDFRTNNTAGSTAVVLVRAETFASASFTSSATISAGTSAQTVEMTHTGPLNVNATAYINGVSGSTSGATGSGATPTTNTTGLRVGRRSDGVVQMDGYTEYVLGWARVLTEAELRLFRNAPYALLKKTPSKSYFFSTPGSDVFVNVSGLESTFSRGTLTPTSAVTLTGQSSTFSKGLFTTTHTNPLTGNSATFNGGTITPFISGGVTLSGLSSTFSRGTLGLTHTNPLTGQGATFSGGLFSFGTAPVTARLVLTQREAGMVFKKRKTRMVLG